jgi:hypothetical protein
MTPEAQRIAIAEASGWTRVWDCAFRQWTQRSPDKAWATCDPDPNANWELHRLPDYLNDLNAMHEAEKVLDVNIESEDSPRYEYSRQVYRIVESRRQPFRSTAAQRAEAFLRTIGKWEESA